MSSTSTSDQHPVDSTTAIAMKDATAAGKEVVVPGEKEVRPPRTGESPGPGVVQGPSSDADADPDGKTVAGNQTTGANTKAQDPTPKAQNLDKVESSSGSFSSSNPDFGKTVVGIQPDVESQPNDESHHPFCNFYNRHRRWFWAIGVIFVCGAIAVIAYLGALAHKNSNGNTKNDTSPTSSPRAGTAIAWSQADANNNTFGQLIYQDKAGELRTRYYNESGGGFSGYTYPLNIKAKGNTPLSILFWDDDGKKQRSVFYIAENGVVSDAVYDGEKWNQGSLTNLQLKPAPESKLAATLWTTDGNPSVWVYFQNDKGFIQEAGMVSDTWQTSPSFPSQKMKITPGAGLTTSLGTKDGAPTLSIYTHFDNKLISYDYIGGGRGWLDGSDKILDLPDVVPNLATISAANNTQKTIYVTGERGFIWVLNWRNGTGWQKTADTEVQSNGTGGLAVTRLPLDENDHVFYPTVEGEVAELIVNGTTGKATVSNFEIS